MSLLLRRRAMMQLAEDGVEGGGPNDGKVIVFRSKNGNYTNARYVSTNYGQSYGRVGSPELRYSSSNDVDCEGGYWGVTSSTAIADIYISGSTPTGTSPSWIGGKNYTQAYVTSMPQENGTIKIAMLIGTSSFNYARQFRMLYRSQSNGTVGILYTTSLPSVISSKVVAACGAFIDGNRQDLTKLIICSNGGQSYGYAGISTASISLDGGNNWSNIKDVLVGSSSLPDGQYRDSVWSFDGKKCAIIYNNNLYVSKDGGQSFEQRTKPIGSNVLAEIKGTEKLKTLYMLWTDTNNSLSLNKSTDLGRTWETVCSMPVGSRFTVNAAGTQFVYWIQVSGSFYYSSNPAQGWTAAGGTLPGTQWNHGSVYGSIRMSLDNRQI